MDPNVTVSLISNGTTILVGVLTAVVAYRASIKGAKVQIEHQQKELNESIERQTLFAKSSIERFIRNELIENLSKIKNSYIDGKIDLDEPFQYGFGGPFVFEEYDRLKYDLIKYYSEDVEEIINIYDIFYLIERKTDLKNFSQKEYEKFKKIYLLCSEKYFN